MQPGFTDNPDAVGGRRVAWRWSVFVFFSLSWFALFVFFNYYFEGLFNGFLGFSRVFYVSWFAFSGDVFV